MPALEAALAALDVDAMLADAKRWCAVNSFTANVAGVNAVGALLAEAFGALPLTHTQIPGGEQGDHHVWTTAAAGPRVLLVGHHDTVFPPGHFETWVERDGKITAPGILDMKGGLAIVRGVLGAMDRAGVLASLPLAVISVGDEEIGSPSSTPHLQALATGARAALVFESGRANDAIITRRKGVGAMTVVAHGKAAHAGNNHKDGGNAIWALSRFVDLAQQLTDYERGVTVNVGTFTGGTSKNTVPEQARCELDLRYETVADAEHLVNALHTAAAQAGTAVPNATIEVTGGIRRLPLERSDASAALMAQYAAHATAVGLGAPEAALLGGGSDANTIGPLGVPVIDGLGPRGAGFHTTSEYVEVATFRPKAEALLRLLLDFV